MSFFVRTPLLFAGLLVSGLLATAAAADTGRRIPLHVVEDGGSCRVDEGGAPASRRPALTAEQLQAIKARMAAAVVAGDASGVIPLNGRGYNYRRADDPTRELLLIQRELESAAP